MHLLLFIANTVSMTLNWRGLTQMERGQCLSGWMIIGLPVLMGAAFWLWIEMNDARWGDWLLGRIE